MSTIKWKRQITAAAAAVILRQFAQSVNRSYGLDRTVKSRFPAGFEIFSSPLYSELTRTSLRTNDVYVYGYLLKLPHYVPQTSYIMFVKLQPWVKGWTIHTCTPARANTHTHTHTRGVVVDQFGTQHYTDVSDRTTLFSERFTDSGSVSGT